MAGTSGQEVADSEVDSLGVEIVLQADEPGAQRASAIEELVECGQELRTRLATIVDTPVVRVVLELALGGPHDGSEVHGLADGTDTVVHITIRRAHRLGGNTSNLLDGLQVPAQLGNDFLVAEGGERTMRPGVERDFMASEISGLQDLWLVNGIGPNDIESSLEFVVLEVVENLGSVWRWAVVKGETPGHLVRAGRDIRVACAAAARPPAVARGRGLGDSIGVELT